jgi:hypothetical protein
MWRTSGWKTTFPSTFGIFVDASARNFKRWFSAGAKQEATIRQKSHLFYDHSR